MLKALGTWLRRPGSLGSRAERAATAHLRHNGYRILARNLRTRLGEIDIVAEDKRNRTLVIVEVKAGVNDAVRPEQHINGHKRRKLSALALQLIRKHRLEDRLVRF